MSKYDELKRLATLIVEVQTSQDVPISKLFDDFEAAACPETILALIAENERLEREAKNDLIAYKAVIERQNELRAENAGYQAYERVNAELRAENDALRKDAARYKWLSDQAELESHGGSDYCLPTVHAWDYKPGPQLNEKFESLDDAIDAAMGQGERS